MQGDELDPDTGEAELLVLSPNSSYGDCCGGGGGTANLLSTLENVNIVFTTRNGNWSRTIALPASTHDGAKVTLVGRASWSSTVLFNGGSTSLKRGDTLTFEFDANNGSWRAD